VRVPPLQTAGEEPDAEAQGDDAADQFRDALRLVRPRAEVDAVQRVDDDEPEADREHEPCRHVREHQHAP
jgi:hypothetical protein